MAVTRKLAVNSDSVVINQIKIGQLERGNQTIQSWINNVRAAERELNPNWRFLLNTYHDIDIDLHLESVASKRIRALKNIPFEWPGLENDLIRTNLQSPWFFSMLELIGRAKFWGYGLIEFVPGDDGLIGSCEEIPRQNINQKHKVITLDMWGNPEKGIQYLQPPFCNYIMEVGSPKYLGLYAKIAPYVLLKRGNLSDFSRFNEMFGMPLRWYEYDPLDPIARDQVTKQAEAQGSAAYVVVPKGTVVNFHEANKAGAVQTYGEFHKIMNDEITIGVLGQTLTTSTTGVGSNALGRVHMQVESELAMEDRIMVELLINYGLKKKILIPHGYPLQDIKGSFTLTEEVSMENKLKMWLDMVKVGLPIAEEDFYEEFGVPIPSDRDVVKVPSQTPGTNREDEAQDPNDPDKEKGGADPKSNALALTVRAQVRSMYSHSGCKHGKVAAIQLSYQTDLDRVIEELIKKIYSREIGAGDVDQELFELIAAELSKAVDAGFGQKVSKGRVTKEMLEALQRDVYVFSGFKTYQMLKEASELLIDPVTNDLRSFAAFREEVLKLNTEYNVTFLQAEYNHAVGSSRMASKWVDFIGNKETLPLLQYVTAGDSRVRESHRRLNKITLPVDHSFWDTYMPPNDWNCRCNVRQLADGKETIMKDDQLPQIKDEFKFNPGKSRTIFPKSHPYYKVQQQDQGKADNNFGLKAP